jgi:hypothetical protein
MGILRKGNTLVWKSIPGFPYAVSNTGLVKSLPREYCQKYPSGKIGHRTTKERILSTDYKSNKGYPVCFIYKNGNSRREFIHRLVAKAFIPNPDRLPQVNHKNGNKSDNRVSNLEWCDNDYNQQHAKELGLRKGTNLGEDNPNSKLKAMDVYKIKLAKIFGMRNKDLAEIFGVDRHTITNITKGKTWKHLSFKVID